VTRWSGQRAADGSPKRSTNKRAGRVVSPYTQRRGGDALNSRSRRERGRYALPTSDDRLRRGVSYPGGGDPIAYRTRQNSAVRARSRRERLGKQGRRSETSCFHVYLAFLMFDGQFLSRHSSILERCKISKASFDAEFVPTEAGLGRSGTNMAGSHAKLQTDTSPRAKHCCICRASPFISSPHRRGRVKGVQMTRTIEGDLCQLSRRCPHTTKMTRASDSELKLSSCSQVMPCKQKGCCPQVENTEEPATRLSATIVVFGVNQGRTETRLTIQRRQSNPIRRRTSNGPITYARTDEAWLIGWGGHSVGAGDIGQCLYGVQWLGVGLTKCDAGRLDLLTVNLKVHVADDIFFFFFRAQDLKA